jgi:hypothetical protein
MNSSLVGGGVRRHFKVESLRSAGALHPRRAGVLKTAGAYIGAASA